MVTAAAALLERCGRRSAPPAPPLHRANRSR